MGSLRERVQLRKIRRESELESDWHEEQIEDEILLPVMGISGIPSLAPPRHHFRTRLEGNFALHIHIKY